MNRIVVAFAVALVASMSPSQRAHSQQPLSITPLAERAVDDLPAGALFWRIETFADRAAAQAAAGSHALVAEADGRAWLFTLGPAGGAAPGATRIAELGPIPRVTAPRYLLRINEARGAPGAVTPIHTHPGSEAFFVLRGEQSIRGPDGVMRVAAGHAEAGRGAGVPMQVYSSGSTDLHALVMFVVDATLPFSSPAVLH